jgi:DNA-binding LacI/PurR family transcriptional regulator
MASVHHVTLRHIAALARVHASTVSLALRDDARLRRTTRQRIQQVARGLGYATDPVTQSLAKYRSAAARGVAPPKIAWITDHPTANGWKKMKTAQQAFLGARECATTLGYMLQHVWIGEANMTPARVAHRLRAEKIMGLLIAPVPTPNYRLPLPWEDFPAVGLGLSLASPMLHLTANHHYRSAKLAVQQLICRGYTRIGLVLRARANERVEKGWLGGFLVMGDDAPGVRILPPLILRHWNPKAIGRWYQRHQPDAIVTRHPELEPMLAKMGITVPNTLALAFLSVSDRTGAMAGIDENARASGAGAMAMVADMITRGEKGIPRAPQRLLFEGTWVDGRTVRRAPAARKGPSRSA